jgi:photosystem II stability/assembly factor-like uncharacterized protein
MTRLLKLSCVLGLAGVLAPAGIAAQATRAAAPAQKPAADAAKTGDAAVDFGGLRFRGIGPASTSGRIGDLAVHPTDKRTWYVAVASGGVWKTTNAGTTWTPIFDDQGSYSIGCITIDPANPLTVWVGTGENNSQRSVAYGDGVYRSTDGGRSWTNMGLKASEHIARIVIDPRDSSVVYVAAQGPLWSAGGDRGLYKTTDGGRTWSRVLSAGEYTGVNDVALDPRTPDLLVATTYQRHRKVWGFIDGGPESGVHRSTDGGRTWTKSQRGLPDVDLGRIGLGVSPAKPDVVYAIVEAAEGRSGFYRSRDFGANWERMSGYVAGPPMYYNEIFPDPKNVDRVYSADVFNMVTDDGGRTFRRAGELFKHIDNHVIWIDPDDTDHLLVGSDGGLYESFDRAATWNFFGNLPLTQFYKVSVDNALPFYTVYGGTQDNNSLGGPSQTHTDHGIVNADWFITVVGDGFQTVVDPKDPNIVYSQSQHGVLNRLDRRTGDLMDIQPQEEAGEAPLRWNWDSPLIISPHLNTRLYFAANRLFRSDDRGDTWRAASADLTRQIDRNRLGMMGRVWSVDAVAKNTSTSFYGNIVALDESPGQEGLLYVGTDDGLVQVTEDGGTSWRRIEKFPGVPEMTYVSRLTASQHAPGTVYAGFNNHKNGDFKPYLLKSTDRGATWTSIASNLPERGSVYCLVEDHVDADLLFVGTEFGLFVTQDGGRRWTPLRGGLPVIQVRDLAIQRRENDLVVATFGRGFYILDDYTPLRAAKPAALTADATLFPVPSAPIYVPARPLALPDAATFGSSFFTAPNPPFGAVFTYHLKESLESRRARRQKADKDAAKKGEDTTYPPWDQLRAEDREETPEIVLTVTDGDGQVIRRLIGPTTAGFHRVAWDLRYAPGNPAALQPFAADSPYSSPPIGPMVAPGTYRVSLAKRVDGQLTAIGVAQAFTAAPLWSSSMSAADRRTLAAFEREVAALQRAVLASVSLASETGNRLALLKRALDDAPAAAPALRERAIALQNRLRDVQVVLTGDTTVARRSEPTPPSLVGRVQTIVYGQWMSTQAATATQRRGYEIVAGEFAKVLESLRTLVEVDLKALEGEAEAAGAPWTPGRVPRWTPGG